MDPITVIVDLVALLAIVAGLLLLVAQRKVRSWWRALSGKVADPDAVPPHKSNDPVRYALTIFGMMLFAFGLILFGFFTAFALFRG